MLTLEGVSAAYGAIHALNDVSLEVKENAFVAIVGPNGAGKTSLFRTISGQLKPHAGRIVYEGQDLLKLPAKDRAHLGIAHVPEGRQVFKSLTVYENLLMGATAKPAAAPGTVRSSVPTRCSRSWRNAAISSPGRCPVVSSRWWRSAVASPPRHGC